MSTSAAALIASTGRLDRDRRFDPPDFFAEPARKGSRLTNRIRRLLGRPRRPGNLSYYATSRTADVRVRKLRAFERVTPDGTEIDFAPDRTLTDPGALVERSAELMTRFVHDMERRFPEHEHVVMTGGKDSQLIWLVPKLAPAKWHVFSAHPNDAVVSDWLERNGIAPPAGVLRHDNANDESPEDTERKIVCGDLYSDPRHIRWLPAMASLSREHDGRCLFWGGTMSTPAHLYKGPGVRDFSGDPGAFWTNHFERTASWQGNYHQTFYNFVGSPYLSPYHSAEIWRELFVHVDPAAARWDHDLRKDLGDRLAGRPIAWSDENPSPDPWAYPDPPDCRAVYRRHIARRMAR